MTYEPLRFGKIIVNYNDPKDVLGIIENYVFDVYDSVGILPGSTVIDLGAGIGDFTILASRKAGSTGKVIAIEPNPEDFQTLTKNISANGCGNVDPIKAAICDTKNVPMKIAFKGKEFSPSETVTIGDVIEKLILSGSSLYIKIDIEGAEADVVRNLLPYLNKIKAILIELHGTKKEIDYDLLSRGFDFKALKKSTIFRKSLSFGIRHPILFYKLFRLAKASVHSLQKRQLFGGIAITKGENLFVGSYYRKLEAQ